MKALQEMLAEKKSQRERLDVEIATLEAAIKRASGETAAPRKRAPRSNVKNFVLGMLEKTRESGLNAAMICEEAERQNLRLERATVSSLLSRLKSDGTVAYDGTFYRLTEQSGKVNASEARPSNDGVFH